MCSAFDESVGTWIYGRLNHCGALVLFAVFLLTTDTTAAQPVPVNCVITITYSVLGLHRREKTHSNVCKRSFTPIVNMCSAPLATEPKVRASNYPGKLLQGMLACHESNSKTDLRKFLSITAENGDRSA